MLSDYTVGLEQLAGFSPRPPGLVRSADHGSDLVVVRRAYPVPWAGVPAGT